MARRKIQEHIQQGYMSLSSSQKRSPAVRSGAFPKGAP